jgi:hypothetical protein
VSELSAAKEEGIGLEQGERLAGKPEDGRLIGPARRQPLLRIDEAKGEDLLPLGPLGLQH